ncbi:hypothetical protein [Bradyrhizobium sp. RDM4]|uniref:hypothetical protein n=1 Tax=Bradyrhizobium sp. RDM4 TaxID=3378765 RepID=UPI0038FCCA87
MRPKVRAFEANCYVHSDLRQRWIIMPAKERSHVLDSGRENKTIARVPPQHVVAVGENERLDPIK